MGNEDSKKNINRPVTATVSLNPMPYDEFIERLIVLINTIIDKPMTKTEISILRELIGYEESAGIIETEKQWIEFSTILVIKGVIKSKGSLAIHRMNMAKKKVITTVNRGGVGVADDIRDSIKAGYFTLGISIADDIQG